MRIRIDCVRRRAPTTGLARLRLWAAIALLLGGYCFGCGIKGPPVPPHQPPLPTVADLGYRVVDQSAELTWRLTEPLSGETAKHAGFSVQGYRRALDQPACETCPVVFEKMAVVPYVDTDDNRYTASLPLEPGFHYRFKVRLEVEGYPGTESNAVQFDHLSTDLSGGAKAP